MRSTRKSHPLARGTSVSSVFGPKSIPLTHIAVCIRFLTDEDAVWSQNAWDHVPPPDDQADTIAASLERQRIAPVPEDEKAKYNEKPAKHWSVTRDAFIFVRVAHFLIAGIISTR